MGSNFNLVGKVNKIKTEEDEIDDELDEEKKKK